MWAKKRSAHQQKCFEERTRIPSIRGAERLCTAVFGGFDIDHVEETAAVTEQQLPKVPVSRRHLIEQLRLFDATLNEDSLLVHSIDRICIELEREESM